MLFFHVESILLLCLGIKRIFIKFHFPNIGNFSVFQESAAYHSCLYRGGRETNGAAALHELGEPQTLPETVQTGGGQQPSGTLGHA